MSNILGKRKRFDEEDNEEYSDCESFGSNFSYQDEQMDGLGCLCKTEKDLLKCLKDARLFWETDENQIPYHYKAFCEDVTLRYNQGHSQEEHLTLVNVLSYFRHIALLYNNDDSLSTLNVVRETGCVTVPGESFTLAEYGGPSSDVTHFLMRNVDRYDDDVSHLYMDLVKAKEPAQSFGNCILVSQARDIYSKVASNMSGDDCGFLIIAATYGSPSFTQLADTPLEKRADAAKRLVQHTKMTMGRKH
ncbi:hypothetical protein V2J09_017598 [Rumex salicifolius]